MSYFQRRRSADTYKYLQDWKVVYEATIEQRRLCCTENIEDIIMEDIYEDIDEKNTTDNREEENHIDIINSTNEKQLTIMKMIGI